METIPLASPPLASVLVQVRFAQVLNAVDEAVASDLQQELKADYPFVQQQNEVAFMVLPGGDNVPAPMTTRLWQFTDKTEAWRVVLATNFVTLQTASYAGHEDFFTRLLRVLSAVHKIVEPPAAERVGARYTQRIVAPEDLARLPEYVRPEILGASTIRDQEQGLALCLTQAQTQFGDVNLTARWGTIPPNTGVDAVIAPQPDASWVMDLDVFDGRHEDFVPQTLTERALEHSRRQYRFFRWAVEPAFLLRYGADELLVRDAVQGET